MVLCTSIAKLHNDIHEPWHINCTYTYESFFASFIVKRCCSMYRSNWLAHLHLLLCISAVDASRVVLSVPDVDGSDYINASYIDVSTHEIVSYQLFNALSVGFIHRCQPSRFRRNRSCLACRCLAVPVILLNVPLLKR